MNSNLKSNNKTYYALQHLKEQHDLLAEHHHDQTSKVPNASFEIAGRILEGIGEATLLAIGEPDITSGPGGELLLDWEPPKVEIHLVIAEGNVSGDAYLPTGSQHADDLASVINLVASAGSFRA